MHSNRYGACVRIASGVFHFDCYGAGKFIFPTNGLCIRMVLISLQGIGILNIPLAIIALGHPVDPHVHAIDGQYRVRRNSSLAFFDSQDNFCTTIHAQGNGAVFTVQIDSEEASTSRLMTIPVFCIAVRKQSLVHDDFRSGRFRIVRIRSGNNGSLRISINADGQGRILVISIRIVQPVVQDNVTKAFLRHVIL